MVDRYPAMHPAAYEANECDLPIGHPERDMLWLKPSAFYFRKALNESRTTAEAINTALIVCTEFEWLRQWSMERGVLPTIEIMASMDCLREAISEAHLKSHVIKLGRFLCHELEELKVAVRAAGLQPPKWIVAQSEAAEKGWAEDNLKRVQEVLHG